MKNKKTIIEKIKKFVFEEEVTEVKFFEAKDSEGNVLRVDGEDFAVGLEVKIIPEGGSIDLAKEGDYILEDGRTIKVDADGKITEIIEAADVETSEEDSTETTTESPEDVQMSVIEDGDYELADGRIFKIVGDVVVEVIEAPVQEAVMEEVLEEEIVTEELSETNEDDKFKKLETKLSQLAELVIKLADEPADEEIKIGKVGFSNKEKIDSAIDALAKFRNKK